MTEQLTPLDTSFLAVESESAHMHVGWVCELAPPVDGEVPSFGELRDHIRARLPRAPRYRQRLEQMPLGLASPIWVDDENFQIDRHVVRIEAPDLGTAAAEVMSYPLTFDRPLWEIAIVEGLPEGRVGVVGKAHHCMVDGIAAVELAALLFDAEPDATDPPDDGWSPAPPTPTAEVLGRGALNGICEAAIAGARVARTFTSPSKLGAIPNQLGTLARAAVDTARPTDSAAALNQVPLSPDRHLGMATRPLEDLVEIKRNFGVTVNDVLLSAVCGALRIYLDEQGERACRLKTMVPVNVRAEGEGGPAGNRISFMFVDLPCEEPNAVRRLRLIAAETASRKDEDLPVASETILNSIGRIPSALRGTVSRLASRSRFFNLTVSNIPGPQIPMYMRGMKLEAAYPVVPIAEEHTLAVGMTSVNGQACFGLYADRRAIPDVDRIVANVEREIIGLAELTRAAVAV